MACTSGRTALFAVLLAAAQLAMAQDLRYEVQTRSMMPGECVAIPHYVSMREQYQLVLPGYSVYLPAVCSQSDIKVSNYMYQASQCLSYNSSTTCGQFYSGGQDGCMAAYNAGKAFTPLPNTPVFAQSNQSALWTSGTNCESGNDALAWIYMINTCTNGSASVTFNITWTNGTAGTCYPQGVPITPSGAPAPAGLANGGAVATPMPTTVTGIPVVIPTIQPTTLSGDVKTLSKGSGVEAWVIAVAVVVPVVVLLGLLLLCACFPACPLYGVVNPGATAAAAKTPAPAGTVPVSASAATAAAPAPAAANRV